MARIYALAGIEDDKVEMLGRVLGKAGRRTQSVVAKLNVQELGKLLPDLIVCDIDDLLVDPLEMVRQLRFVLPECTIAVYTGVCERRWAVACHLAGANCLLLKDSTKAELSLGVRGALHSGCFTDPRFAAP